MLPVVLPAISECSDGDVRLRNRDSEAHGLVEVCIERTWGPVCSRSWDTADATVVSAVESNGRYVCVQ